MKVIVGLGNIGKEYELTRHNVGFMAIDEISKKTCIEVNKEKFNANIGEGIIKNEKVILVKPKTYMNLSGEAVLQIANFYKLDLSDLIIIYDDIDILLGKIRIKPNGSAGTHNGMRNIIQLLDSSNFCRIRIGTGKVPVGINLRDFVLNRFTKDELETIDTITEKVYYAVIEIMENGIQSAMNLYN